MATKIAAAQVKELRDKTGIAMGECKKALEETNGDMDAAIKVLRERGQAKAVKRADRNAAEGLCATAISDDYSQAVVAQLNSETDFVARNDEFVALVNGIASKGLAAGAADKEAAGAVTLEDGRTVDLAVEDIRTKIGEKIELGDYALLSGDVVTGYIHPPGKIAVLVSASAPGIAADKKAQVADELRNVAMHIAAFAPRFLDASQVDSSTLDEERDIFRNQALNEGKPEQIVDKIVDGKIKSFYKDNCLVDQPSATDNKKTVAELVTQIGKDAGVELKLTAFKRANIGSAN